MCIYIHTYTYVYIHAVVQLLSHVLPFATPTWTAALQVSLSFTISWNLLKLMSIDLVMPPFAPFSQSFPVSWFFALGSPSTGASALASALYIYI